MTETIQEEIKKAPKEILAISQSTSILSRIKNLGESFNYEIAYATSMTDATPLFETNFFKFIVLDASMAQNQNDVVGEIQGLRFYAPETPIMVILPKRFDKATLPWIRKSGGDYVMSESDFVEFPKFDFFANQTIGSDFLGVKHGDFELGTSIEIPLYYFMPINRRYFPLVAAGAILDESRLEKIQKIGEVYIRRKDVDTFNQYLQTNQDPSAKGLIRRCRVQFSEFRKAYLKLVNHLTEDTDNPSFEEGKALLESTQKMSQDFLAMLMSASSVFDVINQSVEGEYNSIDRGPERAAIVGYLAMMSSIGNADKAMLAALLSDLGMLSLPQTNLNFFRVHGYRPTEPSQKKSFEQHPQFSINLAAQKKIQLEPIVRDAILHSHCRQDEMGFPVIRAGKISPEAQLIHFVQRLDDRCQIRWGKSRLTYSEELQKMLNEDETKEVLSPPVLEALGKALT